VTLAELYRREYGRILASVIRTVRDITLAEDALQEAFAIAHTRWPEHGTPPNPVAWLLTTARHKAIDQLRRQRLAADKHAQMITLATPEENAPEPQDTLRLIFTCCHPALAPDAQVALTLRTLGGLTTEEIARAFVTPTATIAQRIVRAKTKIKLAGIPYAVPENDQLAERLPAVLAVIYLVFNEGYSASAGPELIRADLCREAIRLSRDLAALLPHEREPAGLLALLLLTDSRRAARTDENGGIVLLEDQDRRRWDRAQVAEGVALLEATLRRGPAGTYTLQAAIAALHAQAPTPAATDWPQIVALYGLLYQRQPSPIIALNHAVAVAMAEGPAAGLALMERIELPAYHLWHAARADLLRRLGRRDEAADAYQAALTLATNAAERAFLERRLGEVL
jgi:RNA polymerase sigma-70 factor (ECF subfamily)